MLANPANWVNQSANGYAINTGFSDDSLMKIELLQMEIKNKFPDLVWLTPSQALHISLMYVISPFIDYEKDKNEIFIELFREYDEVLREIFKTEKRFFVRFSELRVTSTAIIIVWEDNGSFSRIRKRFLEKTGLFPGTKSPPNIIYTTIGRYIKGADLSELQQFVSNKRIDIAEKVNTFRFIQEKVIPMLRYEVIKFYKLS